eukprot:gene2762-982_t
MFHSRKGSHDVKRANSRFIDPRRDTHTRFRALRTLLDQQPLGEIKKLFQRHYVDIYYIFYEELNALVAAFKSKGYRSFKEELEGLLLILEKLLLLVPERIYERWQFNSIDALWKPQLSWSSVLGLIKYSAKRPSGSFDRPFLLKVREIGVKLYLLWLQDLQENVDELGLLVYGSIIPGFPNPLNKINASKIYRPQKFIESVYSCMSGTGYTTVTSSQYLSYLEIDSDWCNTEAIIPLLPPPQGEKNPSPESLTTRFLDRLLDYMTKKMMDVSWKDIKMRESGFYYLFQHFKRFYLPFIFPLWNPVDTLYVNQEDVQQAQIVETKTGEESQTQMNCRWRVLCWFVAFTIRFKKPGRRNEEDRISESSNTDDSVNNDAYSPAATTDEKSILQYETLFDTAEVVRSVLYSTKDNVVCLHEVFRQGFLMPISWSDIICRVMTVYHEWFKAEVCRKVIKMYRNIVLEQALDAQTWNQLLVILLKITGYTLKGRPPVPREKTLGGQLSTYIFQTLFVTWIRASLQVNVPLELWNELLRVISSLTSWNEMISEWAGTIETLTRVLARTVYGVDLADLPLERLTEQKRKKQRGRVSAISDPQGCYATKKSFARGWSRYYKSDAEGEQKSEASDAESNASNVRDFVALLPRTTSVSFQTGQDGPKKSSLRVIQSESSLTAASVLPDVVSGDQGYEGPVERKRTLLEVADEDETGELPLRNVPEAEGKARDAPMSPVPVIDAPLLDAPLAIQETSSSDSSAEFDRPQSTAFNVDNDDERSEETEGLLNEVLESADRIYSRHVHGRKSKSNSISSEDSFASCASFPYSEVILKSDGSRSVTPSIASDRLSRDDLDQFYAQAEAHRSTNSLLDVQTASGLSQSDENNSEKSLDTKPPDIISDHSSATDPDLISFDSDVQLSSKATGSDSQSLDSAAFTLYEGDTVGSFKVPKGKILESRVTLESRGSFTSSCSTLVGDHSDTRQHVRFAEDTREEPVSGPESMDSSDRFRERQDTLTEDSESNEAVEEQSVIAGGKAEGWTPVSATVLWRRMIGILGNINKIKDQNIHAKVFEHLIDTWSMLHTVRQNQGISLDNRSTPPQPRLIPPLLFCSSWCFEAMSLSRASDHKTGRMLAYKLMCLMTVRRHDNDVSREHLTHFYRLLHAGLTGSDQDVINSIISQSVDFYSFAFSGSSALILDFVFAANTIISTQNLKHPRKEAVSLLGSLLCYPHLYADMKIHQPIKKVGDAEAVICGKDLREHIIVPLLKAAKTDPSCLARCASLNCLGVFVMESIMNSEGHPRVTECLCVILASLCFHNKAVSNVALDIIWSLKFVYEELSCHDTVLPLKLLEALCLTTLQLLLDYKSGSPDMNSDTAPEFISKMVLCVLDWAMVISNSQLLTKRKDSVDCATYLALVFKTFKRAHDGYSPAKYPEKRRSVNINQVMAGDSRPIRLSRVQDDVSDFPDGFEGQEGKEILQDFALEAVLEKRKELIKITSKYAITQLINYLGHFPFNTGAVRPHSQVMENEDDSTNEEDLTPSIFDQDNVQFFLLNKATLLSAVEINLKKDEKIDSPLQSYDKFCRFILRDMTGKYCWDHSVLFPEKKILDEPDMGSSFFSWLRSFRGKKLVTSGWNKSFESGSPRLLTWDESSNVDRIDQMLYYVGNTSPECLIFRDQALNVPAPVPEQITTDIQSLVVTSVLKQHNKEQNYVHEIRDDDRINATRIDAPEVIESTAPFYLSRYFIHQFGLLSWEKRQEIDLLKKSAGLIRELKNLDSRPCRETHKIAVFYVGSGQEDKMSIMSNTAGSKMFEDFVSGMAWEVDLATHSGFIGGLERNLSTGNSAPYFATHDLEVIFHVSTRMPLSEGESGIITKLRHLGNDEVHIVWSEHSRDFRRGIVNMEFGDVIIVIYPLKNNLFKIKIDRKPGIPPFGPLFDGAIVNGNILPSLVRSTAINGGRAKRSTMPLFERHYEERGRYINQISEKHVEETSFEMFAKSIVNPCRAYKNKTGRTLDVEDGLVHRTFSLPSRPAASSDPVAMLKLFEAQGDKGHRSRASSSVDKTREKGVVSPVSSTDESSQDLEIEKPRERKRSLSKRFKSGTRTFSPAEQDDSGAT